MASNNDTDIQTIPDVEIIQGNETSIHGSQIDLVSEPKATIWNTECAECSEHYNDQNILQACLRIHSSDSEVRTAIFKCNSCGAEMTWSRHILKHMMVLSGERSYLCGVCAKPVSLDDMDDHTHEGTILVCGVCEVKCHSEKELEIHCLSHHAKDTKVVNYHRAGKRTERKKSQQKSPVSCSNSSPDSHSKSRPVSRSNSMENDLQNPLRIRMENELKHFYERLRMQMQMKPSTVTTADIQEHQNKRLKTVGLFRCKDCGLQFKEEAVLKIHSLIHGVSLDKVGEATASKGQGVSTSVYTEETPGAVAQSGNNGESPLQDEQCTILCGICGQVFTSEAEVRSHCLMHTRDLTNQSKAINQNSTKDGGKTVFDNQNLILANKEKDNNTGNTLPTEPAEAMDLSASGSVRKHLPSSIEQLKLLRSILENNGIISSSDKNQYESVSNENTVLNETSEAMDLSASSSGRFEKSQFVEESKPQSNEIIQVEVITGCSPEHTITEVETLEVQTKPKDSVTIAHDEGNNVMECYIVGEEESAQEGYVATLSAESLEDQCKVEAEMLETQAATNAIANDDNSTDRNLTQENGLQNEAISNSAENLHKCNVCAETLGSEEELYLHYRLHDIRPIVKKEGGPCELELVKDNLDVHLAEHIGQNCEICYKPFEAMEHLLKHSVHNCCFCDSCFCNIVSLEKHMQELHKRQIRYTCEKCGGRYNWLYHLQEHMLMHSAGENTVP